MPEHLAAITYLVHDYDKAMIWLTKMLGFVVLEDTPLGEAKRWVRMGSAAGGVNLLLAKAEGESQIAAVGKVAGGRVGFFLHTDDFAASYARMQAAGVKFRELPRHEAYGSVAVFDDLYGNGWDLIEARR